MRQRKRFQKGNVKKHRGTMWVGQWWEDGHRRNRRLGKVAQMTKSEAQKKLAEILDPLNKQAGETYLEHFTFGSFVDRVFLPYYQRKWKRSTFTTNDDRI